MGENQRVRSARKFRRVCDVKNWVFPFGFCVRRERRKGKEWKERVFLFYFIVLLWYML